ncbi:Ferredoxin-NADP reductase [Chryseolinea serpens]|uniref:Ferredoxin-NADP reductase n=1 Tax=Chryseolinea serpens TaxID=947013 RepID=A0A1M5TPG6_9BACT|nr:FAD-binding oxidoreductase [Chryseolinea serpens]SHH52560.1 Ferredoxin-NADP reductase [Chryseolinea serpens]
MEPAIVKILKVEPVTHNVRRFTLERPEGLAFVPGQAADISINTPEMKGEKRPFTFTGLAEWDHLEFTIKIYTDHNGVTNHLGKLKTGDQLIIHDVFGAIRYYGEGVFIAGGAGVTPFIAIFRQLKKEAKLGNNTLIFSNNTEKDIILREEFTQMLGKNFINTLTQEETKSFDHRMIDAAYLKEKLPTFSTYFYLCGPDPMVLALQKTLISLGAESSKVIVEQF